jgi:molybdate transport system permease protein
MTPLDLSPLWISLKTAFVATLLAFITGIAIAGWMFNDRGKWQGILDGILTLPLVLPPTVVGFLLLLLLGRNSPLGQLLNQWGVTIIFSWPAAVIASTVVAFPLMYKTALGAFRQVDRDILNAARTLGTSETSIFWQVLLPLAWPGVIAGTVLAFARALGEFGATLMLAGSIPGRTQTMPIAIFFAAEAGKMQEALIWVLVMVAIALASIGAIHYWSESQNFSQNFSQSRLANHCSSLINRSSTIVGRWLSPWKFSGQRFVQQNGQARSRSVPAGELRSVSAGESSPVSPISTATPTVQTLEADLKRDLGSFQLQVQVHIKGQPLGMLGASGSGKSMTLKCIAGLETPSQGRIVLNGRVLFDDQQGINVPSRHRRIGFVFQNYALFPHMRVAHNIGFGLQHLSKEQRKARVKHYLELFHLQGLEKHYPHELSGGQQQRVALARALAPAPEALLLDEPLSALDNYLRHQIEQLLVNVFATYHGVTILVTHKLEEAYRICPKLLVLAGGQEIAFGRKEDIFERPSTFKVAQLTECKNIAAAQAIDSQSLQVHDWQCRLQVIEPIPPGLAYVGIRAHHLIFVDSPPNPEAVNTFPCWVTRISEAPHRVTLYLRLREPVESDDFTKDLAKDLKIDRPYNHSHVRVASPQENRAYDLQAEIPKDQWIILKGRPFPWFVHLNPLQLILMRQ